MLHVYPHAFDQRSTAFDKNPKWCDSWLDDLEIGLLPGQSDPEDMDFQLRAFHQHYAPSLPDLQATDSPRRLQPSPMDSPTAWSNTLVSPNAKLAPSHPPYYHQYPRPEPAHSDSSDYGHQARPASGPHHPEVDASSTLSPSSPKTPGAESDINVNLPTSPWPGHPVTVPLPADDLKEDPQHAQHIPPAVSLQHIHPDGSNNPMDLRGSHWTPGSGYHHQHHHHHHHQPYQQPPPYQAGIAHPHDAVPYPFDQGTVSPSVLRTPVERSLGGPNRVNEDPESDHIPVDDEPEYYPPQVPVLATTQQPGLKASARGRRGTDNRQPHALPPQNQHHRVKKSRTQTSPTRTAVHLPGTMTSTSHSADATNCKHCGKNFTSAITLQKHVFAKHTRPFSCIFRRYSCPQTFGSKNEWARHIRVQHLRLEGWRCDVGECAPDKTSEADRHSFDRKDLFTQHLRRMHKHLYTKAYLANEGGSKEEMEKRAQHRCHSPLREVPQGTTCPYCPGPALSASKAASPSTSDPYAQPSSFSNGFETWELYLEHIAHHLQHNEGANNNDGDEDLPLRQWLLEQDLLHLDESYRGAWARGEPKYRIVGCEGKKSNANVAVTAAHSTPSPFPSRGSAPRRAGPSGTRKSKRVAAQAAVAMDYGDDEDAEGEDV